MSLWYLSYFSWWPEVSWKFDIEAMFSATLWSTPPELLKWTRSAGFIAAPENPSCSRVFWFLFQKRIWSGQITQGVILQTNIVEDLLLYIILICQHGHQPFGVTKSREVCHPGQWTRILFSARSNLLWWSKWSYSSQWHILGFESFHG